MRSSSRWTAAHFSAMGHPRSPRRAAAPPRRSQPAKMHRIGFLGSGSPRPIDRRRRSGKGLRELGLGRRAKNIVIDWPDSAEGRLERLPDLASRAGSAQRGCHRGGGRPRRRMAAKNATTDDPDRHGRSAADPLELGLVGEPRAAGREHHGVEPSERQRSSGKAASAAERDPCPGSRRLGGARGIRAIRGRTDHRERSTSRPGSLGMQLQRLEVRAPERTLMAPSRAA